MTISLLYMYMYVDVHGAQLKNEGKGSRRSVMRLKTVYCVKMLMVYSWRLKKELHGIQLETENGAMCVGSLFHVLHSRVSTSPHIPLTEFYSFLQ